MADDPPDTADGYDALADRGDRDGWESPWGDNPLQEHYAWPATRELLPSLDGRRVLDAGCGVGDHVGWLLTAGASVVGIDASERAVEVARSRFGDRATFRRADLTDSLPFDDDRFDGVLCHLVLDHVRNWQPALGAFHRTLASGGWLVFTVVHPVQYYLAYDAVERYYDRTPVSVDWEPPVTSYHRPLGEVVQAIVDAGFRVERFEEPEPPEPYVEHAAEAWNVTERPQVLCARARA